MLEDDTDDVEFIEIECGKDGKPLYISGPTNSKQQTQSIIRQLEKTAGVGNFNYMVADPGEYE